MWLSEQLSAGKRDESGLVSGGVVTVSGEKSAVMLEAERREMKLLYPGGLIWAPMAGEEVIVLRSGDGEQYLLGGCGSGEGLGSGEKLLKGPGGSIGIGKEGITIAGNVEIKGRLVVNGVDILAAIEQR